MPTDTQIAGLLTPQQLRKLAQETAISEQQKAAAGAKKAEEHKEAVRKAFMDREIRPDAMEYLMAAVKHTPKRGNTSSSSSNSPLGCCPTAGGG